MLEKYSIPGLEERLLKGSMIRIREKLSIQKTLLSEKPRLVTQGTEINEATDELAASLPLLDAKGILEPAKQAQKSRQDHTSQKSVGVKARMVKLGHAAEQEHQIKVSLFTLPESVMYHDQVNASNNAK